MTCIKKEYVFSFSDEIELNGNKYNIPEEPLMAPMIPRKKLFSKLYKCANITGLNSLTYP